MKTTRAGDPSMTLRLVLVSMVAALGLTIPSRRDCKRFFDCAESRASSFLAGWDTWRPGEGTGHRKAGSTATRECELCRLARAQVALRAQKPVAEVAIDSKAIAKVSSNDSEVAVSKVQAAVPACTVSDTIITFEPIDVEDEICGGLALELNRAAEGIDLVQIATPAESSKVPTEPDTLRETSINLEWIDKVCGRLIGEVRSAALTAQPSSQLGCPSAEAPVSTAVREQQEQPTAITGTLVRSEIQSVDVSASVEWSPAYGPDLFAAIEDQLAQIDTNNAPATVHQVVGTPFVSKCGQPENSAPVTTAVAAAQNDVQQEDAATSQIPWPVFAPENSVPQSATRVAEEIQVPWPVFAPTEQVADQAIAREPSTPDTRWGQAVHLTCEAVVAWMKVLAGPALVDISAR
jgi:hypothetical protein